MSRLLRKTIVCSYRPETKAWMLTATCHVQDSNVDPMSYGEAVHSLTASPEVQAWLDKEFLACKAQHKTD